MTAVIAWKPPPGQPARRSRYRLVAAELRRQPGEWALVKASESPAGARATASQIRRGLVPAFLPSGHFEVVVRGPGVYVRYVAE